jgi:hypothetical protein
MTVYLDQARGHSCVRCNYNLRHFTSAAHLSQVTVLQSAAME